MPLMPPIDNTPDYRRGPDRRRQPRGGRRPEDRDGCAPLILLVGNDRGVVDQAEAILAKLKFAVSTSGSVDEALRVLPDLRPDIVVVAQKDEARIRGDAQLVPIVLMRSGADDNSESLIEDIRTALRANPAR